MAFDCFLVKYKSGGTANSYCILIEDNEIDNYKTGIKDTGKDEVSVICSTNSNIDDSDDSFDTTINTNIRNITNIKNITNIMNSTIITNNTNITNNNNITNSTNKKSNDMSQTRFLKNYIHLKKLLILIFL